MVIGRFEMSIRILVVDDNRDTLRTYVKALLRRLKQKEVDIGLQDAVTRPLIEVEEADSVSLALEKQCSYYAIIFSIINC